MRSHFAVWRHRPWSRASAAIACCFVLGLGADVEGQPSPPELPETVIEADPSGADATIENSFDPNAFSGGVTSDVETTLDRISRGTDQLGIASSASEGLFGQPDLEFRPLLRPVSALELIPGLIATQHSGSGKANQYFLRGVNLDHGTDFHVRVDGVPINLPTHGHGQGYLDLNWLMPELIESVRYRLGTYYADVGDFSSVGVADLRTIDSLPRGVATATAGGFDYYRIFAATSTPFGEGDLLFAYETVLNNGPWIVPENFEKFNGLVKYSRGDVLSGVSVTASAYRSYWSATNQVAQRAVDMGLIPRFGSLDPSDGGVTDRVTLNGQAWQENDYSMTRANAYIASYDLNLFSNFTYFLDDPVRGDQIQQLDDRIYVGVNLSHEVLNDLGSNTIGFQFRNDSIFNVALNHTQQRQLLETVSQHDVDQQSYSLYGLNKLRWTEYMRTELGLRGDLYRFHAEDIVDAANTGSENAGILSPKASLVLGPWAGSEAFLNWGLSFHSNDARGINAAVDPATPLVRSNGSEIGFRSQMTESWTTTLTAWYLLLDSELVFVGDAGTTEPSGASHRGGVNWTNFVRLSDYSTLDFDYAYVRPRFVGGERIPNAVENVLSAGLTAFDAESGYYGTVRVQSYGPAALIEDNSARSRVTTLVNLQVGRRWEEFQLAVDIFNLLNAQANDITYFYESRPQGLTPAEDFHFHPVLPASARVSATWNF